MPDESPSRKGIGVSQINRAAFEVERRVDDDYLTAEHFEPHEKDLIEEFFPPAPARVLDLGCGAGRTTIPLHRLGYEVIAVDLSWRLIRRARRRLPACAFLCVDGTELSFPDASFDSVLFSFNGIDGIHPVARRIACMREAFRVLRPGGLFQFSTHHLLGLPFWGGHWNAVFLRTLRMQWKRLLRSDWYFCYPDGDEPQFLYSAPPGRTAAQLKSAGFDLITVRGTRGTRSRWRISLTEHHVDFVARKPS